MKIAHGQIYVSATDLVGYLNCQALTALDRAVSQGTRSIPQNWNPLLEVLWERGTQHEQKYISHLEASGASIARIEGVEVTQDAIQATETAMRDGIDVIVQAALAGGSWVGRADILHKVEKPSTFGAWSYEPFDTKLARETKAGSVLQLCLYADLLEKTQGTSPDHIAIVSPWTEFQPNIYRYSDFGAYFRQVKSRFEAAIEAGITSPYPEPKEHCEICRWRNVCDAQRRADDHLCLVAGLAKSQIEELKAHGINTLAGLAATPLPLGFKPVRGSIQSLEKAREQARVQLEARESGEHKFELLAIEPDLGLARLPEPDRGDIFLDFEGDPFVGEHGLEYLTGYVCRSENGEWTHYGAWAFDRAGERSAFKDFVDFVMARWEANPGLHIYHYAPYEPGALKRLMGRYATCEDEIDQMLRAGLFVDLYGIVRSAIRAGVESYSIKKLEPLFGYIREKPMDEANLALARLQADLELGRIAEISDDVKENVLAYNKDDCFSTLRLRDWLEELRQKAVEEGATIARPETGDGVASEAVSEWVEMVTALIVRITKDLPEDPEIWDQEQSARWTLAHTLDFHRREEKSLWWEFFRLSDLQAEELVDERAGIAGLEFVDAVGGTARAPIHRYRFSAQETDLRGGEALMRVGGDKLGTVDEISFEENSIDIKKRQDSRDLHPEAVFAHQVINTQVLKDALIRIGEDVADTELAETNSNRAAKDLLLRAPPRIDSPPLIRPNETTLDAAKRIVCEISDGVLAVQGPPGTGKTYTGARMIGELVRQGKRVGITANSHKVIRNLLNGVVSASNEDGIDLQCIQKVPERENPGDKLRFTTDNAELLGSIGNTAQVAGATAWFWARPDAQESVDVLFVDEAAQMSLANVLAISGAANTLVLLGDPQQLDQPIQGSHPDGTAISALAYLLNGEQTISPDQGLFLEETWRMHPDICEFTSEVFYAGKLTAREHNARLAVNANGPLSGAGLRFLPVTHVGNQNASREEAEAIRDLINATLAKAPTWTDRDGTEKALTLDDILVITPYNAQVFEIQQIIPDLRVGTVDKFQGQEAAIAIYSMATSTPADAPRGMDFLYNLNRLNVATSRGKCISVMVSAPSLLEPECRTPHQMKLANAFCRFRELSEMIVRLQKSWNS